MSEYLKAGSLVLVATVIVVIHYLLPLDHHYLHTILQEALYIPAILGVVLFGRWPGLLVAFYISLIFVPHIFWEWSADIDQMFHKINELLLMAGVSFLVGTFIDKFQRERQRVIESQSHIIRIEKLALLGKLSAGLAHELRNPLGSMKGSIDILKSELGSDHPQSDFVSILQSEIQVLTNRLNSFLTFSKPAEPIVINNSLPLLIQSVQSLIDKELEKRKIVLQTDFTCENREFPMDFEQLRQILLNLTMNAIQQINLNGVIRISTFSDSSLFGFIVEDSGGGIIEEDMDYILDPFFTTKEGGTGLGLSIVNEMVQNMNGTLSVENGEKGAKFTVRVNYE